MKKAVIVLACATAFSGVQAGFRVVGPSTPLPAAETAYTTPVRAPNDDWHVRRIAELEAENARLRAEQRRLLGELSQRATNAPSVADAVSADTVLFAAGSVRVNKAAAQDLVERARSAHAVFVTGYTDNVGNPRVNKNVALLRARSIKAFLVQQGVPAGKIIIAGKPGEYAESNATESGRAANRRVVVNFS